MTDQTASAVRPIPGPDFIARCTMTTWVDTDSSVMAGPLGWLLLGHAPLRTPDETPEGVTNGLLGMADAMRLRPAAQRVPHVGNLLIMRRDIVALDYGHPEYVMRIPEPGDQWRAHAALGRPVCIALGLDPIPPGAGAEIIDRYIQNGAATGRVHMGATGVRTRFRRPDASTDR